MLWFNAKKAVDDVLDKDAGLLVKFGGYINDLNLTDAEVAKINAKTITDVQDLVQATLNESTGRSTARRNIAVGWFKLQAFFLICTALFIPISADIAADFFDLATSTLMISVTTSISIFYFGSYGLVRHNETKVPK